MTNAVLKNHIQRYKPVISGEKKYIAQNGKTEDRSRYRKGFFCGKQEKKAERPKYKKSQSLGKGIENKK
jgi:hypothetical protein